ncbi:MAG: hypothetical protein IIA61_04900 [Candidatus Marinimicrobia bacterium]|nr:hypothetical protein [Candidatus Neomarinimicrobiota bacterium]
MNSLGVRILGKGFPMSPKSEETYRTFEKRIQETIMQHPIVLRNDYTQWFEKGALSLDEVRRFTVQFSVFSNQFLIAQLKKMINAATLEEMRASKEILANEIGVIYQKRPSKKDGSGKSIGDIDENTADPDLVGTEGSVDGGIFRFRAAHFEWLLYFAEPLGLAFEDMGKRKHGTEATLHFMDELERIYGSEDFNDSIGASFAVENWAAAGFWKELINGLRIFKKSTLLKLHLGFFTWHDKVEAQHSEHTYDELKEIYYHDQFTEDTFIAKGLEMLDAVAVFWNGLNDDRKMHAA